MKGARALVLADREEVLRLNAESLPGVAGLDRMEFERLLSISDEHLCIESAESKLVGYLLAFRNDAPYDGEEFLRFRETSSASFIYIDQVVTDLSLRRSGIASTLYRAVELRAKLSQALYLCCEINLSPPNPTSLAFHRNRGFNQAGSLETADGRTVALMTMQLARAAFDADETEP